MSTPLDPSQRRTARVVSLPNLGRHWAWAIRWVSLVDGSADVLPAVS